MVPGTWGSSSDRARTLEGTCAILEDESKRRVYNFQVRHLICFLRFRVSKLRRHDLLMHGLYTGGTDSIVKEESTLTCSGFFLMVCGLFCPFFMTHNISQSRIHLGTDSLQDVRVRNMLG